MDRFLNENYQPPVPKPKSCDTEYIPLPSCSTTASPFALSHDQTFRTVTYENVAYKLASHLNKTMKDKQNLEDELNYVINEKDSLNMSIEKCDNKIEEQKKQLKRTANRETYWREKCMSLKNIIFRLILIN